MGSENVIIFSDPIDLFHLPQQSETKRTPPGLLAWSLGGGYFFQ